MHFAVESKPKEGDGQRNIWNTKVTILRDGIRSNGKNEHIENGETILAVGNSFTFGDNVSDDETWPAILEEIGDTRVINGGVFGYGVDQSYLRMQALASKYRPNIIIFGMFPDDINRCELSERTGVPKPYFELSKNADLVLMAGHLQSYTPSESSFGILRKVLGYSFFIHKVMYRVLPEYWLQKSWGKTRAHSQGVKITCRIFGQLKHYAQKEKVQIYILVQYAQVRLENNLRILDEALSCIDQDVLKLIDTRSSLAELEKHDIDKYESYFGGHMTKEGNHFVASFLWEAITSNK